MKRLLKRIAKSALAELMPTSKLIIGGSRTFPRNPTGSIALTFDDGPHPVWTPRLLDTLQEYNLRGTFFVVGQRAERYPDLIHRIVAEGHTLGNHSYTHAEKIIGNDAAFLGEVKRTRRLLEDMTGRPCTLVRPPKGVVTLRRLRELWQDEQCVVLWNVDPKDFRTHSADDVVDWASQYRPSHGDVLLWHDNHPWAIIVLNFLMSPRVNHPFGEMKAISLAQFPMAALSQQPCEAVPS